MQGRSYHGNQQNCSPPPQHTHLRNALTLEVLALCTQTGVQEDRETSQNQRLHELIVLLSTCAHQPVNNTSKTANTESLKGVSCWLVTFAEETKAAKALVTATCALLPACPRQATGAGPREPGFEG